MGGYDAMNIGTKYATLFSGISGHSSVTKLARLQEIATRPIPFHDTDDDGSVLYWLQQNRAALPSFRFDCGTDDHLIEANRQLHQNLIDLSIEHQYQEFPGAHTWPYWTQHLRDTLRFFGSIRGQS